MRALITGATGTIGKDLVRRVDWARVLSRDPERAAQSFSHETVVSLWRPDVDLPLAEHFAGVDVVFHLAGEPVASERWTSEKKRRIRESRVIGTRNLVRGLAEADRKPSVLVAASAVGYYGDRRDEVLTEEASPGSTFLAGVCEEWEREALHAQDLGMRVVVARIGFVLAPDGGALARMVPPFRLGLGGPIAGGQQWMPWIHRDDVIGALLHTALDDRIRGPVNVVGPAPVRNAEFTRALGDVLHRPAVLPLPAFALKVLFGEMSQILFESQRAVPGVLSSSGYEYRHSSLIDALGDCERSRAPRHPRAIAKIVF